MTKKRSRVAFTPDDTVEDLARSELLDSLNGVSLTVYIRLVAASRTRGEKFEISNKELLPGRHVANRSVQRSLDELIDAGLVRVSHKSGRHGGFISRTIRLMP